MKIVKLPFHPFGSDAFTVWPFIFVHKQKAGDTGLIAHERDHGFWQMRIGRCKWIIKYLFSKKFRFEAELSAYKVSVQFGMSVDEAAELLMTKYVLNYSYEEVRKLLEADRV